MVEKLTTLRCEANVYCAVHCAHHTVYVVLLLIGNSSSRLPGASKSAGPLRTPGSQQQPSRGASSKLISSLSAAEIKLLSSRSSSSLTSKVQYTVIQ